MLVRKKMTKLLSGLVLVIAVLIVSPAFAAAQPNVSPELGEADWSDVPPNEADWPAEANFPGETGWPAEANFPVEAGWPVEASFPGEADWPVEASFPGEIVWPVETNFPGEAIWPVEVDFHSVTDPFAAPIRANNLRLTIGNVLYTIDGIASLMEAAPFVEEGRAMVPLGTIAESLGALVSWEPAIRTVTISHGGAHFILIVNGVPLPHNMGAPIIKYDRVFVPIAYIARHFDADVIWDEEAQAIYINQNPYRSHLAFVYYHGYVYQADYYDHNAVVAAWRSGDTSGLSRMNLEVLTMATAIVEEVVSYGMTDTQKKLAFYNWLSAHVSYDRQFLNNAPGARPNPNSDNPYGALIRRTAICYGYAYAYQLFMDMLGIEGVTVHGRSSTGDHAWNLVHINGRWHLVDIPWRLINVSSQYLWNRGFRWDRNSVPEAT